MPQNKKRKVSALLALSELNDAEKAAKKVKKSSQDVKVEETKLEIPAKKPLLEGEEYEELKKRLRERKKALSCNPIFRLKTVGEEALMHRKSRVPLFMSDIQVGFNLILWNFSTVKSHWVWAIANSIGHTL